MFLSPLAVHDVLDLDTLVAGGQMWLLKFKLIKILTQNSIKKNETLSSKFKKVQELYTEKYKTVERNERRSK